MSKGCGWRDYPNDHRGWSRRSNKFGARFPIVALRGGGATGARCSNAPLNRYEQDPAKRNRRAVLEAKLRSILGNADETWLTARYGEVASSLRH